MVSQDAPTLAKISPSGSKLVAQRKFHFTRERIARLPAPTNGQRAYYYDSKVRGLALAISPADKRTFLLYRKVNGRPERIPIGPYADLSIEQARGRAEEMNGDIALGQNPAEKKRAVRDEFTLAQLFAVFLEQYAKEHKRTWRNDESLFHGLRGWHLRKIGTIKKADVVQLHARIGRLRGKTAANRTIELLSSMFNRACEDFGWEGTNPAAGVTAFREKKRARYLGPTELPAFFQALAEEPNEVVRDFFLLSLLTGARRANLQALRWSDINWATNTWSISADEAKGQEALEITLSPAAVRILEARKEAAESEWVFPGVGRSGHLIEPKSAWRRILKRAGLTDLRIHDLRRTLGSWQAAGGTSLPIIGKSLGHKSLQATQIYARLDLDPVRSSVNRATDAMLVAGGVKLLKGGE